MTTLTIPIHLASNSHEFTCLQWEPAVVQWLVKLLHENWHVGSQTQTFAQQKLELNPMNLTQPKLEFANKGQVNSFWPCTTVWLEFWQLACGLSGWTVVSSSYCISSNRYRLQWTLPQVSAAYSSLFFSHLQGIDNALKYMMHSYVWNHLHAGELCLGRLSFSISVGSWPVDVMVTWGKKRAFHAAFS